MSEPRVPGFLLDSVEMRIFDKIVLKGVGAGSGGRFYVRRGRVHNPRFEGQGMEGEEKEEKPALALSSNVPKF